MRLARGARLGPYEVEAPLGAGGMGEVYRARDTRLDRSVALKILPAEFSENVQLKLRFEREAKAISQLTHPNICTLFDVGDGFLVMELLDGESLADRVLRGPMPLSEVLRYGTEIALALDRAHRAGIIHRDLKPGNVVLTKGGAKLLDFGLAKSASSFGPEVSEATQQKPLTTEGTIVGTFQYMAPEQLEGTEADARTDIFALGCVLYEMLTGKRAFDGKTKTSLIAAIVSGEPQRMADVQPLTPPAFEHVVAKCLAKLPDERWQSAHDIAEELRWIATTGSQAGVAAIPHKRKLRRVGIVALTGWLVALAAIAVGVSLSRNRGPLTSARTDLSVRLSANRAAPLTISPDGRKVAALTGEQAAETIWLRDLTSGDSRQLAGTEGATYPFWSPDSHSIGFFAGAKLKTINVESGAVQVICDAPFGRGGSWSTSGVILFAPNIGSPLMKVAENGGAVTVVTKLTSRTGTHRNPMFLPDGKHFLYCSGDSRGNVERAVVRVGSLEGDVDRKVLDYASNLAFVDGWLLSVRNNNLVAQKFDLGKLDVSGKPVAIAQNVDFYDPRYIGVFAAGGDTLLYHRAPHPRRQLLRVLPGGSMTVSPAEPAEFVYPEVSPDGHRVLLNRYDPATGKSDLWSVDLDSGASTRMTFDATGSMEDSGIYSSDGQKLALFTETPGNGKIWIQPAGGGSREVISESPDSIILGGWSRDGRSLIFSPQREITGQDIEVIHLDGDRKPVSLVKTPANEMAPRFSPDGKWVAYASDESGRQEIYVTNYPSASAKWQVSTAGGFAPFWSADGKQIYFILKGLVYVSDVHAGSSFAADAPRRFAPVTVPVDEMAVGDDGTMVLVREIDADDAPVSVVMNWKTLLREH